MVFYEKRYQKNFTQINNGKPIIEELSAQINPSGASFEYGNNLDEHDDAIYFFLKNKSSKTDFYNKLKNLLTNKNKLKFSSKFNKSLKKEKKKRKKKDHSVTIKKRRGKKNN